METPGKSNWLNREPVLLVEDSSVLVLLGAPLAYAQVALLPGQVAPGEVHQHIASAKSSPKQASVPVLPKKGPPEFGVHQAGVTGFLLQELQPTGGFH